MIRLRPLLAIILTLTLVGLASGQNDDPYTLKLRELWQITGEQKQFQNAFNTLLEARKKSFKSLTKEEWGIIIPAVESEYYELIETDLGAIYRNYFSLEELSQILTFINSSAGKKYLNGVPELTESAAKYSRALNDKFAEIFSKNLLVFPDLRANLSFKFCEKYRVGEFEFRLPNDEVILMKRDENFQTEYRGDQYAKYKIQWESGCSYVMTLVETNDEATKSLLTGKRLITVMMEEAGPRAYTCFSGIEGERMYKVEIKKQN